MSIPFTAVSVKDRCSKVLRITTSRCSGRSLASALGKQDRLLAAGRRLTRRGQRLAPCMGPELARTLQHHVERDLPPLVAGLAVVVLDLVGEVADEDLAKPVDQFRFLVAPEIGEVAVRLEVSLLHQVRGIQRVVVTTADQRASEQMQEVAIPFQELRRAASSPLRTLSSSWSWWTSGIDIPVKRSCHPDWVISLQRPSHCPPPDEPSQGRCRRLDSADSRREPDCHVWPDYCRSSGCHVASARNSQKLGGGRIPLLRTVVALNL